MFDKKNHFEYGWVQIRESTLVRYKLSIYITPINRSVFKKILLKSISQVSMQLSPFKNFVI